MFIASNLLLLFVLSVILLLYAYVVGYPFAKRLSEFGAFELSFPLGIAISAVTALWINNLFNVGVIQAVFIFLFPLILTFWVNKPSFNCYKIGFLNKPILILPLVLSFIVASGVCIKTNGPEIAISTPLFDHIKVALINTMIRDGFPLKNPFCIDPSAGDLFHYYYLFYLLAANIVLLFHCSSLNADILLTFVAAFISILTCFCLLKELFAGSKNIIKVQYLLCLFLSSGPIVFFIDSISKHKLFHILSQEHPLEAWVVQAAWVPQHLLAASCSILALFFLGVKPIRDRYSFFIVTILIGAGFGFSVWVGGVAVAVVSIFLLCDQIYYRHDKKSVLLHWGCVAIASLVIALPLTYNVTHAPTSHAGFPIGFAIYNTSTHHAFMDLLFFFVGALPLWLFVTTIGLYFILFKGVIKRVKINHQCKILFLICFGVLFIDLLMRSQIANNDLAWRSFLLYVLAGNVLLSYYFIEYFTLPYKIFFIILALVGLIEPIQFSKHLFYGNGYYRPQLSLNELKFINQITNRGDRLLLSGHHNENFEIWGGNILSSIMIDRSFCFVNISYTLAFGPNWGSDIVKMDNAIQQLYNGTANKNDLELIKQFQCNKIIVTHDDPIWKAMPYKDLTNIYSDQNRKIYIFNK